MGLCHVVLMGCGCQGMFLLHASRLFPLSNALISISVPRVIYLFIFFHFSFFNAYKVDFICNMGSVRYYIQSAYSLPDETKRIQEIRPFRRIDDSFKKIVITKDVVQPNYDEYGILTINIYDFLLNPDCLEK